MEMFIGVVLPLILIYVANRLQSDYKLRREERAYKENVNKFAADVLKEIRSGLGLPKGD